jgi:hypothetical protein
MVGELHTGASGLTVKSVMRGVGEGALVAVVVFVAAGVVVLVGERSIVVVVVSGIDEEAVVVVGGTVALCPLPQPASESSAMAGTRRGAGRPMNGGYADVPPYPGHDVGVRRYRAEQRQGW